MRIELQVHVRAEDPLEHRGETGDDFVQVQGPRLHHLPPAEGQQLASEVGGPLSRPDDFLGCNRRLIRSLLSLSAAMNRNRG